MSPPEFFYGYLIFKEPIPLTRLAGLSLIVSGVILLVWQKSNQIKIRA